MSPSTRDNLRSLASALRRSGDPGSRSHPLAALVLVTASMALLVGIAAVARSAALSGVHPLEVVFFRNFFCVVWMLPLLAHRGWSLLRTSQPRLYGYRVAVSFVSMLTYFQALALLPIAEVTAISFLAPLFGTLFAIFLLGEHVGVQRWTALLVGFLGAMIMLRPTGSVFGYGQIAALVSAMTMGLIGPLVKQLTAADDADRIVFITNLVLTPISLVPALFVWTWPPLEVWPLLVLLGLFAVLGHMTLVRGFAVTDASLAMTFNFSRLPFSVLVGYLVFGELIDGWTWVGAIAIFAAAAFVTHRETKLARLAAARGRKQEPPATAAPLTLRD
ncbi:MAG: DMT family transporter [Hyphomicrobium sp.]|uniref:DMT family transporter n=1 Tax=Hyphomicrobium sp. TaxID=82 RepID=UPI00132BED8B|nr:DMT family transporter [Hyphomicrobium sp.]KAB2943867.1 MAG: DMT family transporter [Hyphomicrobium sp.]MBZ0209659.1 DMT family transporter [Hyphomicrobium sp.]